MTTRPECAAEGLQTVYAISDRTADRAARTGYLLREAA